MLGFLANLLLGTCSGPTTEAPPPTTTPPSPPPLHHQLPFDVLLEIAARADPATVVCCATSCKPLRRGILDPSFRRRRLAILAAANSNGGHDFDPNALVGFSYRLTVVRGWDRIGTEDSAHVVKTDPSPRPRLRIVPRLLEAFEPVASRDGLVVLRLDHVKASLERYPRLGVGIGSATAKLHVWDAFAARATSLPAIGVSEDHYPLALLNVGATDRSFELLVVDRAMMQLKIFSSKTGRWSADRAAYFATMLYGDLAQTQPAVVGRTVHWLCRRVFSDLNVVLALNLDPPVATMVELPPGCSSSMMVSSSMNVNEILLASVGGRLSCLVTESSMLTVSMWTLTLTWPKASWSRQAVVSVQEMERSAGLRFHTTNLLLEGFGERSGAVILQMSDGALVRLNMGTKQATMYEREQKELSGWATYVCLYEIDLASVLKAMKSF